MAGRFPGADSIEELIQNEINIHKILINDAAIYVYKAPNGYSNANIFKPKKKKAPQKIKTHAVTFSTLTGCNY